MITTKIFLTENEKTGHPSRKKNAENENPGHLNQQRQKFSG